MNHFRSRNTILAIHGASLISSTVHALANRVFVSARSGNDANTCDNINAPCQTFAGAVTKLNPGGEAIVLDSGGYGPVTITKSLTIEAPPGVTAFVHPPSGDAITISAGASDTVVLRGLVLNGGSGHGITVVSAGSVFVENCVISGFVLDGIRVAANSPVWVKDTISRLNGYGAELLNGHVAIEHCRFEGNTLDGVLADGSFVSVRDSVSARNGQDGFDAVTSSAVNSVLFIYECSSTFNLRNGLHAINSGSGTVLATVANSSVCENALFGLNNAGSTGGGFLFFESLGNNMVRHNGTGETNGTITLVTPQ